MSSIPPRNFNDPSSGDENASEGEPMKENPSVSPVLPPPPSFSTKIPPIKIPIAPLQFAPKPPLASFAQAVSQVNIPPAAPAPTPAPAPMEKFAPKPQTTPMLKDFPPIPTAQKPAEPAKVSTPISPTPVAAAPTSKDGLLVFLAVVAFIVAILSAAVLGAGYFELI